MDSKLHIAVLHELSNIVIHLRTTHCHFYNHFNTLYHHSSVIYVSILLLVLTFFLIPSFEGIYFQNTYKKRITEETSSKSHNDNRWGYDCRFVRHDQTWKWWIVKVHVRHRSPFRASLRLKTYHRWKPTKLDTFQVSCQETLLQEISEQHRHAQKTFCTHLNSMGFEPDHGLNLRENTYAPIKLAHMFFIYLNTTKTEDRTSPDPSLQWKRI